MQHENGSIEPIDIEHKVMLDFLQGHMKSLISHVKDI